MCRLTLDSSIVATDENARTRAFKLAQGATVVQRDQESITALVPFTTIEALNQ
jgi:hypothetical protein